MSSLLVPTDRGLWCEAGQFYVDPWRPVPRAIVTHAHTDHSAWGCESYLTSRQGRGILAHRMGPKAFVESVEYGESVTINGVKITLHPAGHILGSSQIRLEHRGEVWVVSGDYKVHPDNTCAQFEPVPCHTFITESTFGLPIYQWRPDQEVFEDINSWWRSNQETGRVSVMYAYALGKAQRVLAGIDASIGPIMVHGAVHNLLPYYREEGIDLPMVEHALKETAAEAKGRGLIVAPPGCANTPWLRKFGPSSQALASGWMALRGTRRRRALDRGFALSDHTDWPGLLAAIEATGAERVGVTHGNISTVVRYLREERGIDAFEVPTRYTGEQMDEDEQLEPTAEGPPQPVATPPASTEELQ